MNVIEEHWQEILQRVKEDCELLDVSYNMWLKPLQVYKYENGILYILVSLEEIAINIINKKYSFPIKSAVAEITGISCEIKFIQKKDIEKVRVIFPSLEEQQKIGSFFKELDDRIELQKQKLEEIKKYKKGLLQQMFC